MDSNSHHHLFIDSLCRFDGILCWRYLGRIAITQYVDLYSRLWVRRTWETIFRLTPSRAIARFGGSVLFCWSFFFVFVSFMFVLVLKLLSIVSDHCNCAFLERPSVHDTRAIQHREEDHVNTFSSCICLPRHSFALRCAHLILLCGWLNFPIPIPYSRNFSFRVSHCTDSSRTRKSKWTWKSRKWQKNGDVVWKNRGKSEIDTRRGHIAHSVEILTTALIGCRLLDSFINQHDRAIFYRFTLSASWFMVSQWIPIDPVACHLRVRHIDSA